MNERAIRELEQMYMMLSEEKKKAIDEAIKALQAVKSCDTCKHDEAFGCPSFIHDRCENYSEWEQADGDLTTALCSLPKIQSEDGQDYVQLADVLETVRRYKPNVAMPTKTGHWIDCEITKSQELSGDAVSREVFEQVIWERDVAIAELKELGYRFGEKQPMGIWKVIEQEPCGDVISRQAVLEAIDVKAWEFCDYLISKNRNDEQKPVSHFADNLRECVREELPSVKQEPCEDAISRQAVLSKKIYTETEEGWNGYTVDADYIEHLPSVRPQEPKTGHWEEVGEEYIQVYDLNGIPSCGDERICSECGFETVFIGEHCSQYKFCPNCGAKMVESKESDHTCHTCKHYTSGERDGSCGSYICKGYSNWESEE